MGNRAQRQDRRLRTGLATVTFALWAAGGIAADCRTDRVELRGDWGRAAFNVEIADDPGERAQGLMYRDEMARSAGMLFVYPRPQPAVAFWMKNTRIPLDIIYADETGTVRRIAHEAVPFDETALPGGSGIQYVLEINAGLAGSLGIAPGTQLRHPAIEAAAWPC
ncbi:hypothetical protein OB2597_03644 [Pseudooceanicola batsensis HTCC2597]|uniref:DUF192 domain-containing protein n=1 Tax=Pseudooceanicola batsensis (strain ATCC BAA-863 / DSM 15984 / KCTC 12145 / HTCC2597) TaxID=252305 RepID=A3U3R2_PSEBH|nr:DUF192 domain-containing protein [Pseudooceanicola batsensis]EAQ01151.1 hypothetical protein OB2597_03644 [Pseudooceanicola batsensis HTCC2597]